MKKRKGLFDLAPDFDLEAGQSAVDDEDDAPEISESKVRDVLPLVKPTSNIAAERIGSFDYEQLTAEHREFLLDRQVAIVRVIGTAVIEAGKELLLAKELILAHYERGSWTAWLQTALSFSEQTARNYMGAAKWHERTPTVGVLPPGALYLGANAPEDVQTEILRLIESGVSVAAADIKELIKEHKAAFTDASAETATAILDDEAMSSPVATSIAFAKHKEDDTVMTGEADQEDAVVADNSHVRGDDEKTNLRIPTPVGPDYEIHDTLGGEEPRPIAINIRGTDQAAVELIARLREVFDDEAIRDLIALLAKTSAASMFDIIDGSHAER